MQLGLGHAKNCYHVLSTIQLSELPMAITAEPVCQCPWQTIAHLFLQSMLGGAGCRQGEQHSATTFTATVSQTFSCCAGQVRVLGLHGQHLPDEPNAGADEDAAIQLEILPLHSEP